MSLLANNMTTISITGKQGATQEKNLQNDIVPLIKRLETENVVYDVLGFFFSANLSISEIRRVSEEIYTRWTAQVRSASPSRQHGLTVKKLVIFVNNPHVRVVEAAVEATVRLLNIAKGLNVEQILVKSVHAFTFVPVVSHRGIGYAAEQLNTRYGREITVTELQIIGTAGYAATEELVGPYAYRHGVLSHYTHGHWVAVHRRHH